MDGIVRCLDGRQHRQHFLYRGKPACHLFRGGNAQRAHALGQAHPVILEMPAGTGFAWCYDENRYL